RQPFPPVGDLPYLLTLPGYGFYWFLLAEEAALPRWHEPIPEPLPDFVTLVMRGGMESVTSEANRRLLEVDVLPQYLAKQRWFGAKDARITGTRVASWATLGDGREGCLLLRIEVDVVGAEDSPQSYLMPLTISWDEGAIGHGSPLLPYTIAQIRRGARVGALYDAMTDERVPLAFIEAMGRGDEVAASDGAIRFGATSRFADMSLQPGIEVGRVGVEQSNSSVLIGDQAMLKAYRKLTRGVHPELEIARFLTEEARFRNTPPLLGAAEHVAADGTRTALAVLTGFVRNQGDGWAYTLNYLDRVLDETLVVRPPEGQVEPLRLEDRYGDYLAEARTLGQRTAELHRALAIDTDDEAFRPEPITAADLRTWRGAVRRQAEGAFAAVQQALPRLDEANRAVAEALLGRREACLRRIDELTDGPVGAAKTRHHGDYHLGQVLVVQRDFYIVDFEGEPRRSLAERRAKHSPLRDVAGMVRSFDYAAWAAVLGLSDTRPDAFDALLAHAFAWREAATAAFLDAYRETVAGCPSYPADPAEAQRLIDLFLLEKALYEIGYEAANRPGWLRIPIQGVAGLLGETITTEETTRGAA
ncbi:MAG TPA: putative maltokinase, partial [Geminicoccaceae bacterium]|nr:putative maltokinase [Geminicoccaceae bacterium]